jgi:hypothetical protein
MSAPGKEEIHNLLYVLDSNFTYSDEEGCDNSQRFTCVHNPNSNVSDSEHEARSVDHDVDDNVNSICSGGDVEWIWEQNIICPEFHPFIGTSGMQPAFNVNIGVRRGSIFSL